MEKIWFLSFITTVFCKFTPIVNDSLAFDQDYRFQIDNTVEYILEFTGQDLEKPPRISVTSDSSNFNAPLMVVARQPKELLSWQIPLIIETQHGAKKFNKTSRTLCHNILKHNEFLGPKILKHDNAIVTVSTASNETIDFSIRVDFQEDFYIEHSKEYSFSISPSEPKYFFYNFTTNVSLDSMESNYDTVILEVKSDSSVCSVVSIQNVSCPIFDLNQDITFRGFYETFDTKGGITIPKYKFPYGFYVVFVARSDDFECTRNNVPSEHNRTKNITLTIKPSITYKDYVNAVIFTICAIGAFYVFFGIAFFFCSVKRNIPRHMDYVSGAITPVETSTTTIVDSQSIDEADFDCINETVTDREIRLCRSQPCLTDLARKDPRVLTKKSYLYLYNVLTVAIFYGLPVIQLVVTYQRMLNETGEQDLCYYNFLCAHPWGLLSDFNHVFSNIGYILLGILFLFITYNRELTHKDIDFDRHFGIPQHYGMFYAMGVALIMEGVLSGSYHVCPNKSNFQFDSSFMYVMAVLCMVKLYQNRHPDINATAYATFGVLAVAILLGMIGILEGTVYFWICFIVFYILTCFYLSIKVYYMGCWKLNTGTLRRVFHTIRIDFRSNPINVIKPCYTARFVLLLLGNFCNWGLSFYALYFHPKNFAVFLLTIFMANTLLYFFFYILMKYLHKETVKLATWIFLMLSTVCAVSAMYFFLHKAVSWSRTPAQSRQFNMECKLLRFYDFHDIWHFLSAIGMFFTFMVLLTLDDDLSHTNHNAIFVF